MRRVWRLSIGLTRRGSTYDYEMCVSAALGRGTDPNGQWQRDNEKGVVVFSRTGCCLSLCIQLLICSYTGYTHATDTKIMRYPQVKQAVSLLLFAAVPLGSIPPAVPEVNPPPLVGAHDDTHGVTAAAYLCTVPSWRMMLHSRDSSVLGRQVQPCHAKVLESTHVTDEGNMAASTFRRC